VVLGQGRRRIDWAWPGVASGNACSRETPGKLVNGHDYSGSRWMQMGCCGSGDMVTMPGSCMASPGPIHSCQAVD